MEGMVHVETVVASAGETGEEGHDGVVEGGVGGVVVIVVGFREGETGVGESELH